MPRSTCWREPATLSETWAARLGQRGNAAHRRAHRAGRRRQPRQWGRSRLRRDGRHREHGFSPPGRRRREPSWWPPPPTPWPAIASPSSRPATWRCAARPSRCSFIGWWARSPSRSRARGLAASASPARWSGATKELDRLLAAFDRMQHGRAQVVERGRRGGHGQVAPDRRVPGAARGGGRLAGTAVRRAACSSLGEPTYGVFGALFREAYGVETDDSLEVARQKLAAGLSRSAPSAAIAQASRRC